MKGKGPKKSGLTIVIAVAPKGGKMKGGSSYGTRPGNPKPGPTMTKGTGPQEPSMTGKKKR